MTDGDEWTWTEEAAEADSARAAAPVLAPLLASANPHAAILRDLDEGRATVEDVYRATATHESADLSDWRWWDTDGPPQATAAELKAMGPPDLAHYERTRRRRVDGEAHNREQLWRLEFLWAYASRVQIDPALRARIEAKATAYAPAIVATWSARIDAHEAWRAAGRPPAQPKHAPDAPESHRYARCVLCDWYGAREASARKEPTA
jgi:hypothetical protein